MQLTHTKETCPARIMLLALVMLVSTLPMYSQYRRKGGLTEGDHYHFGYLSAHVGYSVLDTRTPGLMPVGAAGGGFGIGYEYRNSGFWANVGLQLSMHRSKLQMDSYTTKSEDNQMPYHGYDTQGKATTFHYEVTQTDVVEWNFFDVPILFGYYTHGFHVGAGLKLSYALSARTRSYGTYNFSATNDDYGVEFKNMPDRGYKDYDFDARYNNQLKIGAGLIGEIGYDLLSPMPTHSRTCHVLKLSFYFEYGLNSLPKANETTLPRVVPNASNAREAQINPYLNTVNSQSRTVPFLAGVKITYMVGGSRTARSGFHHGCMCYN